MQKKLEDMQNEYSLIKLKAEQSRISKEEALRAFKLKKQINRLKQSALNRLDALNLALAKNQICLSCNKAFIRDFFKEDYCSISCFQSYQAEHHE